MFEWTEEDKRKAKTKSEKVLARLKEGPTDAAELRKMQDRYSTSIHILREHGWQIKSTGDKKNLLYKLGKKAAMRDVTDEWKAAYYESKWWKETREIRLEFDNYECVLCHHNPYKENQGEWLEVHHWRYDLFNEQIEDLCSLCVECHSLIHETKNIQIHFPHTITTTIFIKI